MELPDSRSKCRRSGLEDLEGGTETPQMATGLKGNGRGRGELDRAGTRRARRRRRPGRGAPRSRCAIPGDDNMNALLKFRPDLQACELKDRLVPVIPNLSAIVLTTSGYVPVTYGLRGDLGLGRVAPASGRRRAA